MAIKTNPTMGFLKRNLKACPLMVTSLLEYPCSALYQYRQGDIDKLNTIKRAATRFVTKNYQCKSSVTALD